MNRCDPARAGGFVQVVSRTARSTSGAPVFAWTSSKPTGAEGIPFHMLRVDTAGNMSKRFSASGLRIPRFRGACPRWNVFGAFLTPGMIRTQLSQMPAGQIFFGVARTVRKESGGFKGPRPQYAISMGCDVSYAGQMVYADGLDLSSRDALVPVGRRAGAVCTRIRTTSPSATERAGNRADASA